MNYEEEVGKLNEGTGTWKPEIGMHTVKILEEPEPTEYVDGDKVTPQIKLQVEVIVKNEKKQLTWFITVGKTTQSAYGQLMYLGKVKGKLKEEMMTLIVNEMQQKNGEKRKAYTIPEAVKAMQQDKVDTQQVS